MARKTTSKYSKEKYEELLLNEANLRLRRDFKDPRLTMVSITRVELNQDFSHAKLYWDTYNSQTRGDSKKAIENISGVMRTKLAKFLDVRHTPEIMFIYDSQFEDELRITQLLNDDSQNEDESEE